MKGVTIQRIAIKALIFARKAVPYVLVAASAAGTVAVTVEAVKEIKKNNPKKVEVEYPKPGDNVKALENEDGTITPVKYTNPGIKGKIQIAKCKIVNTYRDSKPYWKPVIFCASSIACLACSVFIFTKRQQQLIIATHQMATLLQRYTNAATATAGVVGTAAVAKLEPESYPEEAPIDPDSDGMTQFWDPIFNYWFRADERDFLRAAKNTSHSFSLYGAESVENFYARMGVDPPTDQNGDGYIGWGWYMDDEWISGWCEYSGYVDIDFGPLKKTDDGLEYREVYYFQGPEFNMENLLGSCIAVL